jgi:hypothetical protein
MEEQLLQPYGRFSFQLRRGEKVEMIPFEDEPFVVTHVFLVDPKSAAGHGVVAAYVQMGTENTMLAQLSSEVTVVELEDPVELDEEFCVRY